MRTFLLALQILVIIIFSNIPIALTSSEMRNPGLPNFSFVASGDFGCKGEAKTTIAKMVKMNPRFVLPLGDLSYEKNVDCWFEVMAPLDEPGKIRIVLGDHDFGPNLSRFNAYLKHFNMSKPYYSFDYQNVHFLALATAKEGVTSYSKMSEQYMFVKKDLENAHNNKSIDWIIVYGFRPLYSSPSMHPGEDDLREAYHPLFDQYDVDIVLQGHNHNYQRTYPLKFNEGNDSDPIIGDNNTGQYRGVLEGPIFMTVGTAGQDLHDLTGRHVYIAEQFQRHGFVDVKISNNGTNLTSTFYENRNNEGIDQFSIIKGG
jgi:predicted MPP superfamily phosphohydrolase